MGNTVTPSTGIQCYNPKAEWASWKTGFCKIDTIEWVRRSLLGRYLIFYTCLQDRSLQFHSLSPSYSTLAKTAGILKVLVLFLSCASFCAEEWQQEIYPYSWGLEMTGILKKCLLSQALSSSFLSMQSRRPGAALTAPRNPPRSCGFTVLWNPKRDTQIFPYTIKENNNDNRCYLITFIPSQVLSYIILVLLYNSLEWKNVKTAILNSENKTITEVHFENWLVSFHWSEESEIITNSALGIKKTFLFEIVLWEFPLWCNRKKNPARIMRMWVWSMASLHGSRIPHFS